jgi:hypothetical protein
MRDRAVAKPVLNGPGINPIIRELVAAATPQYVEMHRNFFAARTRADEVIE